MLALVLGFTIGMVAMIPLGPLSMTIIGIGAEHGPERGMRAAFGVVGADVVLGATAVSLVSAGKVLPGSVFSGLQWVSAVAVVGLGAALLVRARQLRRLVGRVRRPALTLFVMTAVSPAIGTWVALLVASPFTGRARSLSAFAVGIFLASMVWHPALGAGAGVLGPRLSERRLLLLARIGGVSMAAMGVGLLVA
jgi:arginine exporter protein ArgO